MSIEQTKKKIEVMQAYVDGKEIECKTKRGVCWMYAETPSWDWIAFDYRVKQNWYDNIPVGGVLCWVWDEDESSKQILSVINHREKYMYRFIFTGSGWRNATPLTKEEIQQFINNAPEA